MDLYVPLLRLQARHAFFGENAINRFRFEPEPATAAMLRRLDILMRTSAEGLTLICPASTRAALQTDDEAALELVFRCWSIGASFSLVTALPPPAQPASLVFHSAAAVREDSGAWRLHATAQADASAWRAPVDHGFLASPPAFRMALAAPAIAAALAGSATPCFLVRFGARSTRWKYYLLNDALANADLHGANGAEGAGAAGVTGHGDAKGAAIVDLDGVLSFTQRGYTELPGQRKALTFVSEQAIEMRQHPVQRLQLCESGGPGRIKRILIKRLPNASVAAVGREVAAGNNGAGEATLVSEIYIR